VTRGKIIGLLALVGGLAFGALGGEYRVIDYWRLKRELQQVDSTVVQLQREVDSLTAYAVALETDSATQERVARERFGMIRNGEILYRLEPSER